MAVTFEEFLSRLRKVGVFPDPELDTLITGFQEDTAVSDGEQLGRWLVKRKKLTPYQARTIYIGKEQSLILGNYLILDKLGEGGMGLVLKAIHQRMERIVALKVLAPKFSQTPDAVQRFHREVKAAARLEHPNIVTAHDADEANGMHFLVMQYVEGEDLSALVKKNGPLPVADVQKSLIQAAQGLGYAHERGVVHRDIKPSNMLLDRTGTVKILDMGLARLDADDAQHDQLTGTGQIMGTVDFMAPEQALDTRTAGVPADIYSLGMTLWYLLTARPAYQEDTLMKKIMAHQHAEIPSLRQACPQVSEELSALFTRMVAKAPGDRPQTMKEVIEALQTCEVPVATATDSLTDLEPATAALLVEDGTHDENDTGMQPTASLRSVDADTATVIEPSSVSAIHSRKHSTPGNRNRLRLGIAAGVVVLLGVGMTLRSGFWKKRTEPAETASGSPKDVLPKLPPRPDKNPLPLPKPPGPGPIVPPVVGQKPEIEGQVADPDRKLAQRILTLGGDLLLESKGGGRLQVSELNKLPEESFQIVSLTTRGEITLADCQLIGQLQSLRFLELDSSALTNEGMKEIAKTPELHRFSASRTRISDNGLRVLSEQSKLVDVDVSHTQVTDAGLRSLLNLIHMERLNLDGLRITNEGLKSLQRMTQLQTLYLMSSAVGDEPWPLENLTELAWLRLSGSRVTDKILSHLEQHPKLRQLELSVTGVTGEGFGNSDRWQSLRQLDLTSTPLSEAGLKKVAQLPVERLSLRNTALKPEWVPHLAPLSDTMVSLGLFQTDITNASLDTFVDFQKLTMLEVGYETQVTKEGLRKLQEQLPDARID